MESVTITINHTTLEESLLLINGGIPPESADMMFECLNGTVKVQMGYYKSCAETYPEIYKPCWSEDCLRSLMSDLNYRGGIIRDIESIIPTVLCLWTMKEYREYKKLSDNRIDRTSCPID